MVDHLMPGFSSTMKVYRYSTKTDEIAVHDFLKYTVSSQDMSIIFPIIMKYTRHSPQYRLQMEA